MTPTTSVAGIVVPMDRENVDTDAIMPKQFLKSTLKVGYGAHLFDAWRFLDIGTPGQDPATRVPNPDFVLNQARYAGARVMVARGNFGCGSSREHAPWGLLQYGIQAIIAPSFGDIFRNNALKNGLLGVTLSANEVDEIFREVESAPGFSATVDLERQRVTTSSGASYGFAIDPFRKRCLLHGHDDIGLALSYASDIQRYESGARATRPWAFEPVTL
jgi:3-isopropylmalate/(R)-2-methylmalate dehydratase small subunit